MRIEHNEVYQGWYTPFNKIFSQSADLVSDVIKINKDVVETLKLEGCRFIETATHKDNHTEPYYITLDRFIEQSVLGGEDRVYHV